MPTDRPPTRPGSSRRAPTAPTKIPVSTEPLKFIPYVAAAAAVIGLVVAVRSPKWAHPGALAMGMVILAALGYVALSYRISLKPGDRLRTTLPLVTLLCLAASAVPYAYTLYPPAPRGTVTLAHVGDSGAVSVHGGSATVWLSVRGAFNLSATGDASYFLTVSRDEGGSQRVDGTLHPHAGGPLPEQQLLSLRGPGTFRVRLENVSEGLRLPLLVDVRAKPFSTVILLLLFGALTALAVAIDVMLWRRGIEPSFAAALMLPMVAVTYFQLRPASENLATDLLAAGVIGVLGGGFGGEILARVGRMLVRKDD